MANSSNLDRALVDVLGADPILAALMPDGIFFDVGSHGARAFVIVGVLSSRDEHMFNGRAYEDPEYLVKAVHMDTTADNADAAAARIDAVLEAAPPLTINGYSYMTLRRIERIAYTEVDDVDQSIRWQHRGGRYEFAACEGGSVSPVPDSWVQQTTWIQPDWFQTYE